MKTPTQKLTKKQWNQKLRELQTRSSQRAGLTGSQIRKSYSVYRIWNQIFDNNRALSQKYSNRTSVEQEVIPAKPLTPPTPKGIVSRVANVIGSFFNGKR